MKHVIEQGKKKHPVFILLHGTGGDETSLLEVGHLLDEEATMIGIRGNVLENGYSRYFKRLSDGVFDLESLEIESRELHETIQELVQSHSFDMTDVVLVGYSNGANIGIRLLLDYPEMYQKAILFHPMYPVEVKTQESLKGVQIFTTMGKFDQMVSINESQRVLYLLEEREADVTTMWGNTHQLMYEEIEQAKRWLEKASS